MEGPSLRSLQDVDERLEALRALMVAATERCWVTELERLSREVDRVLDVRIDDFMGEEPDACVSS